MHNHKNKITGNTQILHTKWRYGRFQQKWFFEVNMGRDQNKSAYILYTF